VSVAHIAVVGLGNLMRTDDAVGMHAIERLRADPRLGPDVSIVEGGTLGLDLLYPLEGVTHLLALDAVDAGAGPGTLLRFAGEEMAGLPAARSVHLLGFADLLAAMRLTGSVPCEVVVLGVQPEIIAWGTALSARVNAALPDLVDAAVIQIAEWCGGMAGAWPPPAGVSSIRSEPHPDRGLQAPLPS
jgi:hydrogenase maturation protease